MYPSYLAVVECDGGDSGEGGLVRPRRRQIEKLLRRDVPSGRVHVLEIHWPVKRLKADGAAEANNENPTYPRTKERINNHELTTSPWIYNAIKINRDCTVASF